MFFLGFWCALSSNLPTTSTYSVNGSHVPTHRHERSTVHKVKDYLNIIIGQGTKAILYKLFEFGTQYVKIEWKKIGQNMPVFAEQNGFGPAFLHRRMLRLVNDIAKPNTGCWLARILLEIN
jgi:hypothetical protein